jgi:S-DNA-T family DNA segregation ATPase FtsK/SpoIIIE
MSKIESYVKDIEQVVETSGVRVLAPIQDSGLVGFEVPLKHRTFPKQKPKGEGFNIAIGVNISGETVRMDLRQAPHVLISGATGSGKSTGVASIISQLLDAPAGVLDLVLLDPKMVELAQFKKDAAVYADEMPEICRALKALVGEMNDRYKILQKKKVKNLEQYREKGGDLPFVFVFLDEYAECAISEMYGAEIKTALLTLAGKARAAGIHIVLTTQRPSTKIISGDIKANFPTRIAFKTSSAVDSQVILDVAGAEKLLGKGDMLFLDPTSSKGLQRLQGFNY